MRALAAGIHVLAAGAKTWMAGPSPAMTNGKEACHGEGKTQGKGNQGEN
jgi:hypothetical protein